MRHTTLYDSHIHLSDPHYADEMEYVLEYMRRHGHGRLLRLHQSG